VLYEECKAKGVEFRTGVSVEDAISDKKSVKVHLSSGETLEARVLIGADGINSVVRNIIMKEQKRPEVKP
jgi:2-polyprenyl-6-methoxyphenol hydroxylase-like FAD-dependent oxidoreductase